MKTTTKFAPLSNGFLFPNRFEIKGVSKFVKVLKSNLIYGMCGGMVFSALDYYFDHRNVPEYNEVNELPVCYTKYLWRRQTESTSFSILLKIIHFGSLSKRKSVLKTIENELPNIIARLNGGLPAPLVIIRSSLFQNPTHNHQVLVTGYEDNPSQLELLLYDPNHPGIDPRLVISHGLEVSITQSTGEPVRGFFLNHYKYQRSPDQKI